MPPEPLSDFQQQLLSWFAEHQRDLPWRQGYDPYGVWVSEVMLQQTQVKTVLPYYQRWMARLPRLQDLATIPESELMGLWEGLGYYSRVRNLQKAAQVVCEQHQGQVPDTVEALLKLPGVGRYTAGAIASIAYNKDAPLVDGNVIRVFCRLEAWEAPVNDRVQQEQIWSRAEATLPSGRAREFNQALMELGALVCTPQNPSCLLCPVQAHCAAHQQGRVHELPRPKPRQAPTEVEKAVALVQTEQGLLVRFRAEAKLMQGLWEVPTVEVPAEEDGPTVLEHWLRQELGGTWTVGPEEQRLTHRYTRFKATLHCYRVEPGAAVPLPEHWAWLTAETADAFALPTVFRKLVSTLF